MRSPTGLALVTSVDKIIIIIIIILDNFRRLSYLYRLRITCTLLQPATVTKKCPNREILFHPLSPETTRVSEIKFSLSGNTAVSARPHLGIGEHEKNV